MRAEKFGTREKRYDLGHRYCEHIKKGFSDASFPDCEPKTFKRYLRLYPEDFDTDQIAECRRIRLLYWEASGIAGMSGKLPGFNANSWKYNMANRFGWSDRQQLDVNDKTKRFTDEQMKEIFFKQLGIAQPEVAN